jgi:hypothetical protein
MAERAKGIGSSEGAIPEGRSHNGSIVVIDPA